VAPERDDDRYRPPSPSEVNVVRPIAITMGDPSGIGPEVVFRAIEAIDDDVPLRLFGDWELTRRSLSHLGHVPSIPVVPAGSAAGAAGRVFIDIGSGDPSDDFEIGRASRSGGRAALSAIEAAVESIGSGLCQSLVTAPLHKAALRMAGEDVAGHTELLARLAGLERYGRDFAMFFDSPSLRVALLTVHIPLREVAGRIEADSIVDLVRLVSRELTRLDGEAPRLAVCGLNPHAGDSGLFGSEEEEIVAAVERATAEGIDLEGPLPSDTVFHFARSGRWTAVIALYHDQGLIPVKTLHFNESVNVTLGLPYLRASVDHGTAFDIAGRGLADPSAMRYAIEWTIGKGER
jgi:4-hydroxythreonine-4-phosphate dehydrogenase